MLGAFQLVTFSSKYLWKGTKPHKNINSPLKTATQHEKVIHGSNAFSDLPRRGLQQDCIRFPNFIIIAIIAWETIKALSFWAVTIFDPVWVIKNQIPDGFLFNSVLAWPQIASVRSRAELRMPPTFPSRSFQSSSQDTKASVSSFSPEFSNDWPLEQTEPQAKPANGDSHPLCKSNN